ncbi:MAG: hypothetical protein GXO74_04880, partial [Calditrichaeota bacterium]|nr:hypothetical protein [Calditrichota bacterium]
MKKINLTFLFFLFLFGLYIHAYSQVKNIREPFYLTRAWNPQVGDITVHFHSRFYHNSKSFYQGNHYVNGVSYWDIQGGVQVNYSLKRHYLIGLSQIIYQDNHKDGSGYNLPDDLILQIKAADFCWKN